ncbi:MAG: type II toxin-antitoxin system VapC family toxin [Planctomycetota bacterium]
MTQRPYLLDTSTLLHLVRGREIGLGIQQKFRLDIQEMKPTLSVVTKGEIQVIARANICGQQKLRVLERAISSCPIVDISSDEVIAAYVDIMMFSRKNGTEMKQNDCWIAACAKVTESYLLTTDRDFDSLYGKVIEGEYIDAVRLLDK